MSVSVREIVKGRLSFLGFDGLYCDGGGQLCGCGLDDLFPCGEVNPQCVAAKRGEDGLFYSASGGNYRKEMEA